MFDKQKEIGTFQRFIAVMLSLAIVWVGTPRQLPLFAQEEDEPVSTLYLPLIAGGGQTEDAPPDVLLDPFAEDADLDERIDLTTTQEALELQQRILIEPAAQPPRIDGKIDSLWRASTAYPLRKLLSGPSVSNRDLAGAFRVRYHAEHLYFLITVTDDVKRNDSGEEWWEDDGVEIYLDGDNSRGATYDGVNDYQLVFRWNDAAVISGPNSVPAPVGINWHRVNTSSGYRLEVAIPVAAVGIDQQTGGEFGLDVHVLDDDNGGEREHKIAWNAAEDEAWQNPSFFGIARLNGTPNNPRLQLEAEAFSAQQGIDRYADHIGHADDGDWLRFDRVALQSGYATLRARYSKGHDTPTWIEIRLDQPNGPLVAQLSTYNTGGYGDFIEQTIPFSAEAIGSRDLYVIFRGGGGVADLDWLAFEDPNFVLEAEAYSAQNGVETYATVIGYVDEGDWIRFDNVDLSNGYRALRVRYAKGHAGSTSFEVRLNTRNGPKLTSAALIDTGGWNEYVDQTVPLNAASGQHTVYVRFFGVGGVGNFDRFTWLLPDLSPKTYYVSAGRGNDTNSGLSTGAALRTLQAAADRTLPGDTVSVMNGTYTYTDRQSPILYITRGGRPGAWITYNAYPGHQPLIQNADHWQTVEIEASYIQFEGFAVRGVSAQYTLAQAHTHFQQYINDPSPDRLPRHPGLFGSGIIVAPFNSIRNNKIYQHGGSGIALGQTLGADYLLIEGNQVYENAWYTAFCESGINIWQPRAVAGPATGLDGSQYKIILRGNIAHSNYNYFGCSDNDWTSVTDGNGIILDRFDTPDFPDPPYTEPVLLENNITYNNGGAGITLYVVDRADVINNVAYHNARHPDLLRGEIHVRESGPHIHVINNILVAAPGEWVTVDNGNSHVIHYDYNLYAATDGTPIIRSNQGVHDLIGDPRFVQPSTDPSLADFHLRVGSPAIDSGSDAYLPAVDFAGVARASGRVNRGAFETVVQAADLP